MARYLVPKSRTRVETRAGNSRFITTIARADTAAAAREFLRGVREEMPDAAHHVYAYIVGFGGSVTEGMSDDGEPAGTSGPPTMAVLRGAKIGDIALVTTRYFGGTKLGTGGLVSAYTAAAQAGLAALETEERVERVRLAVEVPYAIYELVKRALADFESRAIEEDFGAQVRLQFEMPVERVEELRKIIGDLSNGSCAVLGDEGSGEL
ncbi:MAG: YigZ family protein [Phycisphaerae bacterium]